MLRGARIDYPNRRSFDQQCGEHSRTVCSSVDPDPIVVDSHLRTDGMPMNDHKSVIPFVQKERLADPAQVCLKLLVDLDAGSNARMDE
jgi:hypothetical protein